MSVPNADNSNSLAAQVERLEAQARFLSDQNAALARECETLRSRNSNLTGLVARPQHQRSTQLAEDPAGIDAKNQQKIRDQAAELTLLLRSKQYLKEQLIHKGRILDEMAQELREAKRNLNASATALAEVQSRVAAANSYFHGTFSPHAWRMREILNGS